MMAMHKIASQQRTHIIDNYTDLCGYGALAGECSGI